MKKHEHPQIDNVVYPWGNKPLSDTEKRAKARASIRNIANHMDALNQQMRDFYAEEKRSAFYVINGEKP